MCVCVCACACQARFPDCACSRLTCAFGGSQDCTLDTILS